MIARAYALAENAVVSMGDNRRNCCSAPASIHWQPMKREERNSSIPEPENYLKQTYRSPMRIVPKAEGGSIFFDINLSLKNLFLFPHIKISCLTKAYLCNLITPDKW